jgi:hypothetical protein
MVNAVKEFQKFLMLCPCEKGLVMRGMDACHKVAIWPIRAKLNYCGFRHTAVSVPGVFI